MKVEGKAESEKASKKDKASEDGKDTPWFLRRGGEGGCNGDECVQDGR